MTKLRYEGCPLVSHLVAVLELAAAAAGAVVVAVAVVMVMVMVPGCVAGSKC